MHAAPVRGTASALSRRGPMDPDLECVLEYAHLDVGRIDHDCPSRGAADPRFENVVGCVQSVVLLSIDEPQEQPRLTLVRRYHRRLPVRLSRHAMNVQAPQMMITTSKAPQPSSAGGIGLLFLAREVVTCLAIPVLALAALLPLLVADVTGWNDLGLHPARRQMGEWVGRRHPRTWDPTKCRRCPSTDPALEPTIVRLAAVPGTQSPAADRAVRGGIPTHRSFERVSLHSLYLGVGTMVTELEGPWTMNP